MAGYCRCGVTLYESHEGLCPECYPLSRAAAEKQDREVDRSSEESRPGGAACRSTGAALFKEYA